ncbi:MAG: phosphoribosylaminoimidazolesuccinocarboxamide synthase [Pseudomonadales bacterium]|nr:phosphoribosylaminoimidazolesuccinocarboxamide synthase [Pseudomonadales bacterium]
MSQAVTYTDLPLANKRQGKVRDLYDLTLADNSEGILIIATDRVSVFDVVLGNGIPGKGKMLTQISKFWFDFIASKMKHHLVSMNPQDISGLNDAQREMLDGRIMICRKTKVVPVECIVRGYLTGSGWKDYQKTGKLCGIELPEGMQNSSKIDQPIFTPSTKADQGHDENISFDQACDIAGRDLMHTIRSKSLEIYSSARDYARQRGIIIADTKFEFGVEQATGDVIVIDEVLTPDSSRFWPLDEWRPGGEQNSFDKQYVRNYTEKLVSAGQWDKAYPAPSLPDDVIENTLIRYQEAFDKLTN